MKPILIIDDARAITLFRRLCEFLGTPVSVAFLRSLPIDLVRDRLAFLLDELSNLKSDEASQRK